MVSEEFITIQLSTWTRPKAALIDTSTLIVLDAFQLLAAVSQDITLILVPEVRQEFERGAALPDFAWTEASTEELEIADARQIHEGVDGKLLTLVRLRNYAVLSEDARILQKTSLGGGLAMNAGMAFIRLCTNRTVDPLAHSTRAIGKQLFARYKTEIRKLLAASFEYLSTKC